MSNDLPNAPSLSFIWPFPPPHSWIWRAPYLDLFPFSTYSPGDLMQYRGFRWHFMPSKFACLDSFPENQTCVSNCLAAQNVFPWVQTKLLVSLTPSPYFISVHGHLVHSCAQAKNFRLLLHSSLSLILPIQPTRQSSDQNIFRIQPLLTTPARSLYKAGFTSAYLMKKAS